MATLFFNAQSSEQSRYLQANRDAGFDLDLHFVEGRLGPTTAALAAGHDSVCAFVNDQLDRPTLTTLAKLGVKLVALRCAGFNQVDRAAAAELGMTVARVPAYSPEAVAEHTLALILGLNRRIFQAYNRVREMNFSLDGLMGFNLHGKVVGVVGTGKIGLATARILRGFGCEVLAFDPQPNPQVVELGARYVPLEELLSRSRIVSLHCPLMPETHHLIDAARLALMQPNAMLVNTSRGGLIDTVAAIHALKKGRLGGLAIDVYEEEESLFFQDQSLRILQDDVFARLLTFRNVLVTAHQAFYTEEAVQAIVQTTLENLRDFATGGIAPARLVSAF